MQRPTRSLSGHGTIVSVGERTFPVFYMLSEIGERPMIGTLDLLDESMPFLAGTWLFESTVSHQLRLENGERFTFAVRTYDRTGRLEIEGEGVLPALLNRLPAAGTPEAMAAPEHLREVEREWEMQPPSPRRSMVKKRGRGER